MCLIHPIHRLRLMRTQVGFDSTVSCRCLKKNIVVFCDFESMIEQYTVILHVERLQIMAKRGVLHHTKILKNEENGKYFVIFPCIHVKLQPNDEMLVNFFSCVCFIETTNIHVSILSFWGATAC